MKQQMGIGTGAVEGGIVDNVLTEGSTAGGAAADDVVGNEGPSPKKDAAPPSGTFPQCL